MNGFKTNHYANNYPASIFELNYTKRDIFKNDDISLVNSYPQPTTKKLGWVVVVALLLCLCWKNVSHFISFSMECYLRLENSALCFLLQWMVFFIYGVERIFISINKVWGVYFLCQHFISRLRRFLFSHPRPNKAFIGKHYLCISYEIFVTRRIDCFCT